MKLVALLFSILSSTLCISQKRDVDHKENFLLRGKVIGRDTGRLILRYIDYKSKWVRDTTYLKDGRFEFIGEIYEPTYATINGYSNYINFYDANDVGIFLEPTIQSISLVENDYEDAKMEGSKTQTEASFLKAQIDSVKLKTQDLSDELLKTKKELFSEKDDRLKILKKEKFDSLHKKLQPSNKEIDNVVISFISNYPDSYVSANRLYHLISTLSLDSAELLYNGLTDRIKNSKDGKWDSVEINKKKQNAIGVNAPDFNAKTTNGKRITLLEFKGKFVLLDFWASWCLPCREAIPSLKNLYRQYHLKGLEIITISIDKTTKAWQKAVREEKISNWYNVHSNEEISKNYINVNEPIPSQVLINRNGKIIWRSNNKNEILSLEQIISASLQ